MTIFFSVCHWPHPEGTRLWVQCFFMEFAQRGNHDVPVGVENQFPDDSAGTVLFELSKELLQLALDLVPLWTVLKGRTGPSMPIEQRNLVGVLEQLDRCRVTGIDLGDPGRPPVAEKVPAE